MSLKSYKITLTTIAPIHIGSGQTIRKQEYIYDKHQSRVHIVNGLKMTKFFKEKNILKSFLAYIKEKKRNSDLFEFLQRHGIKREEWINFINYSLPVHQGKNTDISKNRKIYSNKKDKSLNDINMMIRDGNNDVYFPGSSLKGALRTAIQGYNHEIEGYIMEKAERTFRVSQNGLKTISRDEADKFFNKIKVSDSKPISSQNIAIYQKMDINKKIMAMPLYRECIDVGTKIEFDLTIEDEVIDGQQLKDMIRLFYKNYWEKWVSGFERTNAGKEVFRLGIQPDKSALTFEEPILYVGGGSGFVSKTLFYQAQPERLAKQNTFNVLKKRHKNPYQKMRVMPNNVPIVLKGTVNTAKNEWYQMGACKVEITPN